MLQLIVRRLFSMIPVILLVSVMVFSLILLVPGDPATTLLGETASQEEIDAARVRLGLDDPVLVQYGRWVGDAVQGDFGTSLFSAQDVWGTIAERLPVTLSLAAGAMAFAVLIGVPMGLLSSVFRGRRLDRLLGLGAATALAMPNYFVGMLLVLVCSIWNDWLPGTGYTPFSESPLGWFQHLLLPWVTLGLASSAVITRQLRSSMIGVMDQDYVRTARAKGLRGPAVVLKHAFKNASIPAVTVLGSQVAYAVSGTVIIDRVFGLPGIGQLAVLSVEKRDLPMILGVVVFAAVVVLITNLLVDISYGYLNPKIRRL